jgi:hypothetical protein
LDGGRVDTPTSDELLAELWADLDAEFSFPPRQQGDIDVAQIMERYGLSENGAYNRMDIMVRKGGWKIIKVMDDGIRRKVLRKEEQCQMIKD